MGISLVILAAGQGSRMQSDLPKVLHKLAACPLVVHAMRAGRALDPARVVVVVGHGAEAGRKPWSQMKTRKPGSSPKPNSLARPMRSVRRVRRWTGRAAMWWCCMAIPPSSGPKRWKPCKPPAPRMMWWC